jgi:hypothetical protein
MNSMPPEPAFMNFDQDVQLRGGDLGLSIGQIQMQLAHKLAGRNGFIPSSLLNHTTVTSVKQSHDFKRNSMALSNIPVLSASLTFNKTKTPANKHTGPQTSFPMTTPSNKYKQKTHAVVSYVN